MPDPYDDTEVCTCLCLPCAEYTGCEACPDCVSGCDACGYEYPVIDLATGQAHHDG